MSAKGGITEGKSHKEGGIPMVVKSTGQQVELEGGEGVINKRNMASEIFSRMCVLENACPNLTKLLVPLT